MTGSYISYRVSWEESKSTDSLKLQMLDDSGYAIGGFSFIDMYENDMHTISVIDSGNNCIFLAFRLKFESNNLGMPLVQFASKTNWYTPYTDEVDNHRGFTIDDIEITNYPNADGVEFEYDLEIPVYTSTQDMDIFIIEQHYREVYEVYSNKNTIKKAIKLVFEGFEYNENKAPYELFDSKTALKIKLLRTGR